VQIKRARAAWVRRGILINASAAEE